VTETKRRDARSLAVVVLAAGRGKRLRSELPKVLHPVCGRAALWHVLTAARAVRPERIVVVVHHGADLVRDAVRSWAISPEPVFVEQGEPLGTGHAVLRARRALGGVHDVLALAGDDPLIEGRHLRELMKVHRRTKAAASLLTSVIDDAAGYGRVLRDGDRLVEIVEESDATGEQREIREIATLFYAFRRDELFRTLPKVGRENRQREHYLPDVLGMLVDAGERVSVVEDPTYVHVGLNSRGSLAEVARRMRARINAAHMQGGVSISDPDQTFIDVGVRIGADSIIRPLTFLEGETRIAEECEVGPSTRLSDTRLARGASVTFSVVEGARIGPRASVGPFARVHPGTVLGEGARVGSFVEVKGSAIGRGSKVPHLSYVGDATIGEGVNVGAGTVTVNFDGYDKHRTVVGDHARVGSDTMLVAPVRVGKGAATGAGSVITKDVPAGALAVERSEQRNVPGYRKKKDAQAKAKRKAPAGRATTAKDSTPRASKAAAKGKKKGTASGRSSL
jgi:bifunctional UDP-N-acetylglucosamine pyrophosphorylase / glucosamine-1-phosphate N-acetyltransferase